MKPFVFLFFGVIVGWAASGVDLSREAVGQSLSKENTIGEVAILTHANNLIEDDMPRTERFQVSSYGQGTAAGCFVVDSMTGRLWHATREGVQEVQKGK